MSTIVKRIWKTYATLPINSWRGHLLATLAMKLLELLQGGEVGLNYAYTFITLVQFLHLEVKRIANSSNIHHPLVNQDLPVHHSPRVHVFPNIQHIGLWPLVRQMPAKNSPIKQASSECEPGIQSPKGPHVSRCLMAEAPLCGLPSP